MAIVTGTYRWPGREFTASEAFFDRAQPPLDEWTELVNRLDPHQLRKRLAPPLGFKSLASLAQWLRPSE